MMEKYIIPLPPVTKKNSQRILKAGGRQFIAPSEKYCQYENLALCFLRSQKTIDYPVEVTAIFYMPTRRRVDLTNLLEAIDDILVKAKILADDNSQIIVPHDGSRVMYDKNNPRTEVYIREYKENGNV